MQENKLPICQSCGMPMQPDQYGTDESGQPTAAYCTYCYQRGAFVGGDCTLDEMIERIIPFEIEAGVFPDEASARAGLKAYLPTLKRWQN